MSVHTDQTVSVVMPCFNGMPHLAAALSSALNQTYPAHEIIVIDDGSNDESAACVRRYQNRHPRADIRLMRQAQRGEAASRNMGVNAARGRWVAMLAADDAWHPAKLEKQLAAAVDMGRDCVLVHTGIVQCLPDGRRRLMDLETPARRVGWCASVLLEEAVISHSSMLVNRDALVQIGGYDPAFSQACEIDICLRLSAIGTFAFVPEHLLHERVHPARLNLGAVDQLRFHHRAIRKFFQAQPTLAGYIGRDAIRAAMAGHVEAKLKSMYWRCDLDQFRQLLEYAEANKFDSRRLREWRRRQRDPEWLIRARAAWPAARAKDAS